MLKKFFETGIGSNAILSRHTFDFLRIRPKNGGNLHSGDRFRSTRMRLGNIPAANKPNTNRHGDLCPVHALQYKNALTKYTTMPHCKKLQKRTMASAKKWKG